MTVQYCAPRECQSFKKEWWRMGDVSTVFPPTRMSALQKRWRKGDVSIVRQHCVPFAVGMADVRMIGQWTSAQISRDLRRATLPSVTRYSNDQHNAVKRRNKDLRFAAAGFRRLLLLLQHTIPCTCIDWSSCWTDTRASFSLLLFLGAYTVASGCR